MIGANTLQEFVVARQAEFAGATGDLSRLLTDIGTAAKMVNRHINRAGLSGILGAHQSNGNGSTNVQGEAQQKLDVYADDTFTRVLQSCLKVGGIVSEEQPGIIHVDHSKRGEGRDMANTSCALIPWTARQTSTSTSAWAPSSVSTAAVLH
jgi:fructose-1,6-bisphosphatase I